MRPPLEGVLVVELGERLGVSVCGSILADLGADVALIEPEHLPARDKWSNRVLAAVGKRSIRPTGSDPASDRLVDDLVRVADVILLSSDVTTTGIVRSSDTQIVCDLTAFGSTGPMSGQPYSDALIQSVSGLADTTGKPQKAPCLIGLPFCEVSAGVYAAAGVLAALRIRRARGFGQRVEVALFDCAVSALSTFLPFYAVGKPVTRTGNGHSLAAPWNAYRASDGWVMICTATDAHWQRLCSLIGQPELAQSPEFARNSERVARRAEVDQIVEAWTRAHPVSVCLEQLAAVDIASGPISPLEKLDQDPNLRHRDAIRQLYDPHTKRTCKVPANPLGFSLTLSPTRFRVPGPGEDRAYLNAVILGRGRERAVSSGTDEARPLTGLRVLEIGQYTTAPLVGRQLGALGADVIKIEPLGGEGSRTWPPTQGDCGYFFMFSNSDKRSIELDLRDDAHRSRFRSLLEESDILVENLKPGSLARLGFGSDALLAINPRLIYCAISGFGASSAYPGRPAFDTVVQAMSGFMDLTRADDTPTKAGISAADVIGGEFGLLAVLAALEIREATNEGQVLDISMQDAAVAATASLWSDAPRPSHCHFLQCTDGYICVEASVADACAALEAAGLAADRAHTMDRSQLVEAMQRRGIKSVPVHSVAEVVGSEQAVERQLLILSCTDDGRTWPLLNCPIRLARTPALVQRPIGSLGESNNELNIPPRTTTSSGAGNPS